MSPRWIHLIPLLALACRAESPPEPAPAPRTTFTIKSDHVESISVWTGIRLGEEAANAAAETAKKFFRPYVGKDVDRDVIDEGKQVAIRAGLAAVKGEVSRGDRLQLEALVVAAIDLALVLD